MGAKDRLRAAAVAGLLLTGFLSAFAQNWTLTIAPTTNWSSIAMSADGNKLVAAVQEGLIYTSTNGGTTWTATVAPFTNWSSVASSADGNQLATVAPRYDSYGGIWTSTNGGAGWTLTTAPTTNNFWNRIASSADGRQLIAADHGSYHYPSALYTSTNYGAAWAMTFMIYAGAEFWTFLASSADGTKCMAASTWYAYVSTDAGQTWSPTSAAARYVGDPWTGLCCSADGYKWVVVSLGGQIQLSVDAGWDWTTSSAPSFAWQAVASSADGSKLVAAPTNAPICLSTNYGDSWFSSSAMSLNWQSVASSADGCKLAAVVNGGGIYTWQTTLSPKLNITPSGGALLISWIVPSMPFVLQETADLNMPDWTAVPMTPILNLTNLHHEVTVPLSGTNRFYRLQRL